MRSRGTAGRRSIPAAMLPRFARSTPRMFRARHSMTLGADRSCALDGALGERDGLGAPAGEHQVAGQPREDARLIGRRRRPVEQVDGLLEQPDRGGGVAGQPRRVAEAFPGPRPPSAVVGGVGIDEFDGASGRGRPRARRRRPGSRWHSPRRTGPRGRGRSGRSAGRHEVPELDRALVLPAGLGVGVDRARGVAGRDRGTEGAGRSPGPPASDGRSRRAGWRPRRPAPGGMPIRSPAHRRHAGLGVRTAADSS